MPRGFLVKRNRRSPGSYRTRKHAKVLTPDCHEKGALSEHPERLSPVLHEDGARVWSPHVEPAQEAEVQQLTPVGTRVLEQQDDSPLYSGTCVTPELPFLLSSTPASVPFSRPHTNPYGHESNMHAHLFPSLSVLNEGPHVARKRPFIETDRRLSKVGISKKPKVNRKLNFEDEVTTSPVLGLRIKKEAPDSRSHRERSMKQPLGEFICQLCKEEYRDPFSLAQHKCSRIVRVEYRCPECDKVFSCPANLASHRRWHKPRPSSHMGSMGQPPRVPPHYRTHVEQQHVRSADSPPSSLPLPFVQSLPEEELYECRCCGKKFRRQAYLKKHLAAHEPPMTTYSQARDSQVFLCHICGARFPSTEIRDKHRLWHQDAQQLYQSKQRQSTFFGSPGLTRHINKTHTIEDRHVMLLQMSVRP
uniref:INSM transcriptional repressor 2 n=1 Tax=Neogobius melanostomus TaxID=47308 RepID=A0A8C6SN35_9GOBI